MVSEALDSFGNVIHVHTTSLQSLQPLQSFIYPSSGRHSSSTTSSSAAAAAAAAAYSNDGYPQQPYQRGEHHYENSGVSASGRIDPNLYSKIETIPSYKTNLHGGGHVYTMSPPPPSYDHTATLYSATTSMGTTIAFNPSGSGEGNSGSSGNNIQYEILIISIE